jgi:hypothetical protein
LDAYESSSSETEDHYRLEAAYWLTPLPADGLLTLVCAWPEIGLPETQTDLILPDLAVRAAEAFHCGISQRMLKRSHLHLSYRTGSLPASLPGEAACGPVTERLQPGRAGPPQGASRPRDGRLQQIPVELKERVRDRARPAGRSG